jgi:hypothetical protein
MPEFTNEPLNCSFKVPDRPTVRQQLAWYSQLRSGESRLDNYWEAAKAILQDWQCPALPDYKTDLDSLTDPTQTSIIIWAGSQVLVYMQGLEDLPKN